MRLRSEDRVGLEERVKVKYGRVGQGRGDAIASSAASCVTCDVESSERMCASLPRLYTESKARQRVKQGERGRGRTAVPHWKSQQQGAPRKRSSLSA